MSCSGLSGESLKKCKADAAAKKKKSTTEIDFSKATTDLNSVNFRNKDVQNWEKKSSSQRRGVKSTLTGLRGLGQTIRAPRLTKKKKKK
jgi:hypothetical protein